MGSKVYFESPINYPNKFDFYDVGSTPNLLKSLLDVLDNCKNTCKEIYLSFYLFNNSFINDKLTELALLGITVNVVTIPIEGYDASSPKDIRDLETRNILFNGTKYSIARHIFGTHFKKKVPNFNFSIFPHIYLRSENVKTFSRGNMPYSLHIKSFLLVNKDGTSTLGMSSSNFAVRDLVKEESLLIVDADVQTTDVNLEFYKSLLLCSIPISEFDFNGDYTNYKVVSNKNSCSEKLMFIAPFYKNSGFSVEDRICELLISAKKSIKIVGQHICPINYTYQGKWNSSSVNAIEERSSLLPIIIEKCKEGLCVEFLSQTFASGDPKEDSKYRNPANTSSFVTFYNSLKNSKDVSYYVNENIHSKYIIIDDTQVIYTSFNYTPTQFIYLDQVSIDNFKNNPGKSYHGIYSEVGQFFLVSDIECVANFVQNFTDLITRQATVKVLPKS